MSSDKETIFFGGGCFWCTEAVFKMLKGVITVTPGYAGGASDQPTYETVSQGTTGHAEVVQIEYDPATISLDDLLTVFFATHDPTTPNQQGNDVGSQYRSIIFYTSDEQRRVVENFIQKLNTSADQGTPIVTEVQAAGKFYRAEEYHKNYYQKNSSAPYCQIVINPKLKKVQEKFSQLLASQ